MRTRPGAITYNPPGTSSGTAAKVDAGITSVEELAQVATTNLSAGAIRVWVLAEDGTTQVWKLYSSTAATTGGIQRPNDYNSDRPLVWFKASS